MSDLGSIFPPRDEWDVAAYETDEVVAGYRGHRIDDPIPGPNHSPAYRWGWANAHKDKTRTQDGFEAVRSVFIRMAGLPQ